MSGQPLELLWHLQNHLQYYSWNHKKHICTRFGLWAPVFVKPVPVLYPVSHQMRSCNSLLHRLPLGFWIPDFLNHDINSAGKMKCDIWKWWYHSLVYFPIVFVPWFVFIYVCVTFGVPVAGRNRTWAKVQVQGTVQPEPCCPRTNMVRTRQKRSISAGLPAMKNCQYCLSFHWMLFHGTIVMRRQP